MAVKKLSIKTKKGKSGKPKLVVHKNKPEAEVEEGDAHLQMDIEEATEPAGEVQEVATKKKKTKGQPLTLPQLGQEVLGQTVVYSSDGLINEQMEELIAVVQSNKPMANVGFGMDRTINLGNYENVKVHVAIHVPSEVDEEEIEGNYEFAKGWCEMKMGEVLKDWIEEDD